MVTVARYLGWVTVNVGTREHGTKCGMECGMECGTEHGIE